MFDPLIPGAVYKTAKIASKVAVISADVIHPVVKLDGLQQLTPTLTRASAM